MQKLKSYPEMELPPHMIDPRPLRIQRDRKEGKRHRRRERLDRIAQKRSWLLH
jgi:hypothetical protein